MKEYSAGESLPPKPVALNDIEDGIRRLLIGLGQEHKKEIMENTPRRIAEMYQDIINAPWCDIEIPWKCFPNRDTDGNKLMEDLVVVTDCHFVSLCEHHLAPAFGVAHFCYVPNEKLTGYSKIKKGLNYLARQPQLNERLLKQTLDVVEKVLEPKGCALILQSMHTCLACKANAPSQEIVTVQGFRGCLKEDPFRREFLSTAYGKRPVFGAV
jgi:GTP cyclohydrolase I